MNLAADVLLLIVDAHHGTQLHTELESRGWLCIVVETARDVLEAFRVRRPDLILIDHDLPDGDGLLLIPKMRGLPVIVCSASQAVTSIVFALKSGADDFVRKPYDLDELDQRIRAVLLRCGRPAKLPSGAMLCGPLAFDQPQRRVTVHGDEVRLTPTEYRLTEILLERQGTVVSRHEIALALWGESARDNAYDHVVDVYLGRLRPKLRRAGMPEQSIRTVRGAGYMLSCTLFAQS